jgi:hypothetical protein
MATVELPRSREEAAIAAKMERLKDIDLYLPWGLPHGEDTSIGSQAERGIELESIEPSMVLKQSAVSGAGPPGLCLQLGARCA